MIGIDINESMLDAADRRRKTQAWPRYTFTACSTERAYVICSMEGAYVVEAFDALPTENCD